MITAFVVLPEPADICNDVWWPFQVCPTVTVAIPENALIVVLSPIILLIVWVLPSLGIKPIVFASKNEDVLPFASAP